MDKVLTKDGQKLPFDRVGSGKKIAILVHGIGGSSHTWLPFAMQHRGDYTFIIPNLRGYGKSKNINFARPEDVLTDYADDLDSIIQRYKGTGKVTLCALSMGSYAVMRYFQIYGTDDVEKFLSIDQSPKAINNKTWQYGLCGFNQEKKLAQFNRLLPVFKRLHGTPFEKLEPDLRAEFLDACGSFFESAFHRRYEKAFVQNMLHLPVIGRYARAAVTADKWESYYHCLVSYQKQNYDFRPTMKKLNIPTALFIGWYSEMYPAEGQLAMADANPSKIRIQVFDESHALMFTAPLLFIKRFNRFLQ